ncbi:MULTISPECIES: hypothetical protein [unclassified Amycolatopsis]|uniref:hypothetical protein n=1 Tax=unclassified Amycolatopsis TaxID=2618356 RepID=UPI002E21BB1B|nr:MULTISPECIES: hypothetical protein [unclassified Amycolatopsis]
MEKELKPTGAWLFSARLSEPGAARVRRRGAEHRRAVRGKLNTFEAGWQAQGGRARRTYESSRVKVADIAAGKF